MSRGTWSRAGCATLVMLLSAGVAVADGTRAPPTSERRRIVGLLDVKGPSSDMTRGFEAALEKQLDTKQYWLVTLSSMHERLSNSTSWTDGCQVGPCVSEARVQTGAELVVLAALTGAGTSFGYVVTLVRTDTGDVVSQQSERCDVCTLDEAMNGAILSTIRLLVAVPDVLPAPGHDPHAATAAKGAALEAATSPQAGRAHSQQTGKVLVGVGVAAAIAGVALYFAVGDKPASALGLAGAGLGLAAGGIVLLTF